MERNFADAEKLSLELNKELRETKLKLEEVTARYNTTRVFLANMYLTIVFASTAATLFVRGKTPKKCTIYVI